MLKLLNPTDARSAVDKKADIDSRRALEVQELLAQKYRELADVEKTFENALESHKARWLKEEQEHKQILHKTEREVVELEERRKRALIPITEQEKVLNTIEQKLGERIATVEKRETDLTSRAQFLEDRIDTLTTFAEDLDRLSKVLENKEKGIQEQAKQVEQRSKEFTQLMENSNQSFMAQQKALDVSKSEHKTLLAQLENKQAILDKKEKELRNREILLNDRYQALAKAVEEAKRKYNVSK